METFLRSIITCMTSDITCSGALFYTLDTNRFLLLYRNGSKRNNQWGIVGGTNESSETPWEGLKREIVEEIGSLPTIKKTIPLETFISSDKHFQFHTYLCVIEKEFIPNLNGEHTGYAWVKFNHWPKPLHQGLRNTLNSKINKAKLETVFKMIELF
jgi:8-oxo-dGTP pyrophosphatase MutT (NUDIX family)